MTQRPDLFQLDRNHPLAKGLVFAGLGFGPGSGAMFDASLYKNHGTLYNMTPATDWVFVPELGRWGLDFGGTTSYVLGTYKLPSTYYYTVTAMVKMAVVTRSIPWGQLTNRSALQVDSSDIILWDCGLNGSTGNLAWVWTRNTNAHVFSLRVSSQGSADLYVDGTALSAPTGVASVVNQVGTTLYIGGRGTTNGWNGIISDFLVHDRLLSPSEIADLADPSNVYLSGLIAGRPRRRYVFLGGGSTVEINATLAALELTGNAAGVSVGTDMTAAAGAVELSGLAAAVSSGTDIAATTAACEASGLNATVSVGTDIAAGVGNLDATAQAADVSVGTTFAAGTGSVAASGLAATVSTGDSIEATTAAVELSGLAGSVSAGTTFTGGTGAVSLSGLAADVSVGTTINGSLATLIAAALTADVSATVSVEAATAAMAWTSLTASVGTGGRIKRPHMLHGGRLSHDWGIKTGGAL